MTAASKNDAGLPYSGSCVTIVMPAHNAEKYIAEAIHSVRAQTWRNWELIVVDDCSSDETLKIAFEAATTDNRIKVLSNLRRAGPAVTRNRAIQSGNGRYLAFLDADDLWFPHKLELQLQLMRESDAVLSFAPYEVMTPSGAPNGEIVDLRAPTTITYRQLLRKTATVGCLTVIIDRQRCPDVRMPPLDRAQDYACWLEVLRTGGNAVRHQEVLGRYRLTPGSVSRNKFRKAWYQWCVYRRVEKLPIFLAIALMPCYAFNAIFRK